MTNPIIISAFILITKPFIPKIGIWHTELQMLLECLLHLQANVHDVIKLLVPGVMIIKLYFFFHLLFVSYIYFLLLFSTLIIANENLLEPCFAFNEIFIFIKNFILHCILFVHCTVLQVYRIKVSARSFRNSSLFIY